ncbi:hypothetical protein CEXT_732761 [Caerostris extrusa]|uniref:Uncharacterized protein n=1 Tax=Caerostris extrusa TaxID=172846 RepID=A0AAV4R0U2_CAEEX|nr:hypothetical protein CEXT_732761 [Caerostris extrusa]
MPAFLAAFCTSSCGHDHPSPLKWRCLETMTTRAAGEDKDLELYETGNSGTEAASCSLKSSSSMTHIRLQRTYRQKALTSLMRQDFDIHIKKFVCKCFPEHSSLPPLRESLLFRALCFSETDGLAARWLLNRRAGEDALQSMKGRCLDGICVSIFGGAASDLELHGMYEGKGIDEGSKKADCLDHLFRNSHSAALPINHPPRLKLFLAKWPTERHQNSSSVHPRNKAKIPNKLDEGGHRFLWKLCLSRKRPP